MCSVRRGLHHDQPGKNREEHKQAKPEPHWVSRSTEAIHSAIADAFALGGLEHVSDDCVTIESAPGLAVAPRRTALRADTTLRLMTDEEYAAGQKALEAAAARETKPQPIFDTIDLLAFRRP